MALIKCPECKKKVYDQCENCPNCGYPIKANFANTDPAAYGINDSAGSTTIKTKKPIFKRVWFWIAIAVIIAVAVVTVIILLNREVKPKVDENGNPIFVELTDEVYTNADDYLGYYVTVKGKVFQNLGDNGDTKGVQVWIAPDSCEQNLMIHYTTEETFKDGDYVICTGYIKEIHTYTNAYGTKLSVPLIYSTDLRSASYIEVMSPTISTITTESLTYEKYGYSVTVDKIEFAENETRLYLTTSNNGNAAMYVDASSSVIVQNGKQYTTAINFEADYEELPNYLSAGASASGVVVFPAIDDADFEYVLEMHSDNFDEQFDKVTFRIGKETSSVFIPVSKPKVEWELSDFWLETNECSFFIEYVRFYDNTTDIRLSVMNEGTVPLHIDVDSAIILQNKNQLMTKAHDNWGWEDIQNGLAADGFISGVISFPVVEDSEFEFGVPIRFGSDDKGYTDVVFVIDEGSVQLKTNNQETEDQDTKPPQNPGTNQSANRYQEAITEAQRWANIFYPTDRYFIYRLLVEPSLEQGFAPFSHEEADYALNNADIDWADHALADSLWYVTNNSGPFEQWEIFAIFDGRDFTDAEISYAVHNCGINWLERAINDMKAYWDYDYTVIVTFYDFYDYLAGLGYDDSTIIDALNNTSGYYRGEAVETEQERVLLLLSYGYTREAIINWYSETMDYSEAEALVDSCM